MGKKSPSAPVTYIQKKGAPIVYQTYVPDEHYAEGDRDTAELQSEINQAKLDLENIEGLGAASRARINKETEDRFKANYAASLPDTRESAADSGLVDKRVFLKDEWDANPGPRRIRLAGQKIKKKTS